MMAKLLIIGGTGFFGKSILDCFKNGGLKRYKIKKIIILARSLDDFFHNYSELLCENVEFVKGDISNILILPKANFVIHAAASTKLSDYTEDNFKYFQKSFLNFCSLLSSINKKTKILFCSSGAVYGKNLSQKKISEFELLQDDLSQLTEEQRFYCLTKRFSENEIVNLGKQGFNVSIARCFAFSGKYLPRNQHYAIGNFLNSAESGKTIEVKAEHPVIRSYMHADELVKSLMHILAESNSDCPIYNVGSQNCVEIRDLARKIATEYRVDVKIPSEFSKDKCDFYVPNVEKLNKLNNINNNILVRELISKNPTVLIGSGIHKFQSTEKNVLNDWHLLLFKSAEKFKINLRDFRLRNLTYVFEDLIYLISFKENIPAYKAENLLKKEICRIIKLEQNNVVSSKLKEKLSHLTKSQFISLNVDTSMVDIGNKVKMSSNFTDSIFKTNFKIDSVPLYFLNGNVNDYKHLSFGLRSIANQIIFFEKEFNKLKKQEKVKPKFNHYNSNIVEANDYSWLPSFFYNPVLIVGASIGEHELGLRYLLNQRKRNFSNKHHNNSVYLVLDKMSIDVPGYREDLNTLGIYPIVFESYSKFWEGI